jgi:AAA15 family ATPase/GTPase
MSGKSKEQSKEQSAEQKPTVTTIFDYGKKQLLKEIELYKKKIEKLPKRIDNRDAELKAINEAKKNMEDHLESLVKLKEVVAV